MTIWSSLYMGFTILYALKKTQEVTALEHTTLKQYTLFWHWVQK